MALGKNTHTYFDKLLSGQDVEVADVEINNNNKYVIFSDLHMGDKGSKDRFKQNEDVFLTALDYYKDDYSAVLLGDIEDFYKFPLTGTGNDFLDKYEVLYKKLLSFQKPVYRVAGNHDAQWLLEDPLNPPSHSPAFEAVRMLNNQGQCRIMLTHGHGGEAISTRERWFGKFFSRLVRPFDDVINPLSSFVLNLPDHKDEIYYKWAKKNGRILICGHTHNAISATRSTYDWIPYKLELLRKEIYRVEIKLEPDRKKAKKT